MKKVYFIPIVGRVYQNRNGQQYLCLHANHQSAPDSDAAALFQRISDGWTLTAHGILQYEDGLIEWNYSTGGHWPQI